MAGSVFDSGGVEAHYSRPDLGESILAALAAAGKDPTRLTPADLAPIDEFHIGGRQATFELARQLGLKSGMQVLDVGCGLGGPSRYLAAEFGCRVTGLDLTEEYCRVAAMLARRLGLEERVVYRQGDALAMPFDDASFDVLWMQHAGMNIPDKSGLCGEMWRVLKPGGVLAVYDICAGTGGAVHFPVPWARGPSISFLATPAQLRATMQGVGFEIRSWRDVTEEGRSWFRRQAEKGESPRPLGLHLLLGSDFPTMVRNQVRNLEEDRIAIIEAVARRPWNE